MAPTSRKRSISAPASDDRDTSAAEVNQLDIEALSSMLRRRRADVRLSVRQAAEIANVSFMTLSRVEAGSQPDLATFLRLCGWLRVAPATFLVGGVTRETSTIDEVTRHLVADPRLNDAAANRIADMVQDMYRVLATNVPSTPAVACHLRAKAALRPGVADRLGALLADMHYRLLDLDADGAP